MQNLGTDPNNVYMSALESILMNIMNFTTQIQDSHFNLLQEEQMKKMKKIPQDLEDPTDPQSTAALLRCELQETQASHELKDL